jgi:PAS domain S-box-containing protein
MSENDRAHDRDRWLQRVRRDGTYEIDLRSGVCTASEALAALLGLGAGTTRDLDGWCALVHADDRALIVGAFAQWRSGGASDLRREYRVVRPSDGATIWLSDTSRLEVDAAGAPLAVFGLIEDVTEQRRHVESLRLSEARFRALIEQSPIPVAIHRGGIGLYANPAHMRAFRIARPEDVVGRPVLDFVAPEGRADVVERMQQRSRGEPRENYYEFTALRTDGTRFPGSVTVGQVELEDGPAVMVFHTDLSAQREAEQGLLESEERFRIAFESAGIGMALVALDGRPVKANAAMQRLLGYSEAELAAMPFRLFTHPDDADADGRLFEEMLQGTRSVYQIDKRYIRRDGQAVWGRVTATMVRDGEGRPLYGIGMVEDVTDRKRAEDALRQSELRFRTVLEQAAVGFVLVEPSGEVIEWNRAMEDITEIARTEAAGRPIWELQWELAPVDRRTTALAAELRDAAEMAAASGQGAVGAAPTEFEIEARGGRRRTVLLIAFPIQVERGYRISQVFWDVTARKEAEEVGRRRDARLRQAQKLEALGALAGGIAHDFNNILGAVMGYVELLRLDAAGRPQTLEDLDEVMRACLRARDLVKQILSFGRQATVARIPVDVRPVVNEAANLLRSTLPPTIRLEVVLADDLPPILAEPTQIHQVIMNLCTNAVHAMRESSGELRITLGRVDIGEAFVAGQPDIAPGAYVELTVRDTGCGMHEETLTRIFEPFFTTKGPGEGTGLGLSVVHGIVRDHDGSIHVDSAPGQGTLFRIYFPGVADVPEASSADPGAAPGGNRERILIVDDEPALGSVVHRMLTRLGYQPAIEADPKRALARVRAEPSQYDLVITDLNMPGMTGIELAAALLSARPGLPVILLTGHLSTYTPEAVRGYGIRRVLAKPVDFATLAAEVDAALR